ncbi:DUF6314 family protein [Arthrobacter sp. ISL-72]|uniref:DUF6314 family protein n=1 Tax=Arthrobacter sp. ISL-72 TaxID=2819114 RepID=UPI0020355E8E|nr:DUF6314 family protein [Arthrobacter sp. ISL-72]
MNFDLRAYLLGSWSVERTLWDRSSDARGTFTGVARFSPKNDDGGLAFHEEGTMRWPTPAGDTYTGPASRDYLLHPADSPDAMDMTFPDGRPFHRMSFRTEASQDRHWCDPDSYRVTYALRGPHEFSYAWDVRGPRKDLLLESVLRRLDADDPAPNGPPPNERGTDGLGS